MFARVFLRAYSSVVTPQATARFGQIVKNGDLVALHAPVALTNFDVLGRLKQNERAEVIEKIETALLWEQLSRSNKRLVFRPTQAQFLDPEAPKKHIFKLGRSEREIVLSPRKYDGPPSLQNFRTLALTCRTAEDTQVAFNLIDQSLESKDTGKNMKNEILRFLLRRAAAAGTFQSIYSQITSSRARFDRFMDQGFYHEALRIYALRIPFISRRSKDVFKKLHKQSTPNVGRDLLMVYSLAAYGEKFGFDLVRADLDKYIAKVAKIQDHKRLLKGLSMEDLTLGSIGLRLAGEQPDTLASTRVYNVLLSRCRHRPEIESIVVKMSDPEDDGSSELDGIESEAEATN